MWLLSGLLTFVRLQGFAPDVAVLFNTLVTSMSKSLAHRASVSVSHTAFIGLEPREFYFSHLPAYFSDVNKRSMLSSPLVCSDSFAESDVTCLLADTQTSSSLGSQQALVEVASRGFGARCQRYSPRCSPARSSLAVVGGILVLLLVSLSAWALTRLLHLRPSGVRGRVFVNRGHVPRPAGSGDVLLHTGEFGSRGGPILGLSRSSALGIRSSFFRDPLFHVCLFPFPAIPPAPSGG